jgi:hypothetical protein
MVPIMGQNGDSWPAESRKGLIGDIEGDIVDQSDGTQVAICDRAKLICATSLCALANMRARVIDPRDHLMQRASNNTAAIETTGVSGM